MGKIFFKGYKPKILSEYISSRVDAMDISKQYKPAIVDILLRRIYEFDLSENDIELDLNTLKDNLHEIGIGKSRGNLLGCYVPSKKKIFITRSAVIGMDAEAVYSILTHEMFHALLRGKDGKSKLQTTNMFTSKENISLEEAIVEEAADRLTRTQKRNEGRPTYLHKNIYGYSDITFITDAIEAVYGVTEKQFLKNGIFGRERLVNFLSKKVGEDKSETVKFLDRIEVDYSILHEAFYKDKFKSKDEAEIKEHREAKKVKVILALSGIFMQCEEKITSIIKNSDVKTIIERNNLNNIKYNHNKLVMTMRRALEDIERSHCMEVKIPVLEAVKPYKEKTRKKINLIETAMNIMRLNGSEISDEKKKFEMDLLESAIKEDVYLPRASSNIKYLDEEFMESNPDVLEKFGESIHRERLFRNSKAIKHYYEEEDFPLTRWNNIGIFEKLRKTLLKDAKVTWFEKRLYLAKEKYYEELNASENQWILRIINRQIEQREDSYEYRMRLIDLFKAIKDAIVVKNPFEGMNGNYFPKHNDSLSLDEGNVSSKEELRFDNELKDIVVESNELNKNINVKNKNMELTEDSRE